MFQGQIIQAFNRAHKIVKQLLMLETETLEVRIDRQAVLAYLRSNEDRPISNREIARGSGVSPTQVKAIIKQLVEDKAVVKSESKPGRGTRYWIKRSPNANKIIEVKSRLMKWRDK